jgi:hypothetical protein
MMGRHALLVIFSNRHIEFRLPEFLSVCELHKIKVHVAAGKERERFEQGATPYLRVDMFAQSASECEENCRKVSAAIALLCFHADP